MKQLLYILSAAALIATGCQKQEVDPVDDSKTNNLTFNALIEGASVAQVLQAQSRAAAVDVNLQSFGFYLAGYHTEGLIETTAADAYPNVFSKDINDKQDAVPLVPYAGEKFTLKTIKWALDDITYLSFFGWSQAKAIPTTGITSATTGIFKQTQDIDDKGYPWIDIRNADAPADQTDIVGSRSLDHKNDAVISAVDLDFRHLLAKITFKAKSTSGAAVNITAANVKYAADKVHKKARYTFGSDPATLGAYGSFAEYHSGTAALGVTYPSITDGSEALLGSALLLPQALADGDISLELKYKISPNGGDIYSDEKTTTLPLAAITFEQGNNYLYEIDIQATELFLPSYPIVTNWHLVPNTSLPAVTGPMDGQTLLLLDGYDKPYIHTDGKAYWLDRSGYNRHCEIVGYDPAMYSAAGHTYTFNNSSVRYLKIPLLQSVTALTVSVIAQQRPGVNGSQNLINLWNETSSTRPFFTHMGYNGSGALYFDTGTNTGASGRLLRNFAVNSIFDLKIMWTFQKQDRGAQNIYRNASLEAGITTTSEVSLSALSGKMGSDYAGEVSYVRVTNRVRSAAEIEANFAECELRFDIPTPTINYTATPANTYAAYPKDGVMQRVQFNALKKPAAKYIKGSSSITTAAGSNPSTSSADNMLTSDIVYQAGDKIEVSWQTAVNHGTTGGVANMVIKSIKLGTDGIATVVVNGVGNAVLSYKRGSTILWNYHIWVTDSNPFVTHSATGGNVNGTAEGGGQARFMDRNLGALSATSAKPSTSNAYKYFGVMYQNGRSTPFTGQGVGNVANIYTKIFNASGTEIISPIGPTLQDLGGYTLSLNRVESVTTAIQNPILYYSGNSWITLDIALWSDYGDNKSIYDPCPYGYRVPKNGSWNSWPNPHGQVWTRGEINGGVVMNSAWWPAAGYRHLRTGVLAIVSHAVDNWSSTYYGVNSSYVAHTPNSGQVYPGTDYLRSYGLAVRCVQEGY